MMNSHYFNYSTMIAGQGWERRTFARQWQRIYGTDRRWVAPHYQQRQLIVHPSRNPYLARTVAAVIHLEALPQRKQTGGLGGLLWEEPVAAAILSIDPARKDGTGRLALLHCANDEETLDRIIGAAQEELWRYGGRRLVGPTGLSPLLPSGVLTNYFHVTPPLHTPYNPPYLAEIMATSLQPIEQTGIFTLNPLTNRPKDAVPTNIELVPLTARIAQSSPFATLWHTATHPEAELILPDTDEIAFLWQWITVWPWVGWVAMAQNDPVGFVLLQPDMAEQNRIAKGGQNPLWALWLQWRRRYGFKKGRLIFGGVIPGWQERGIGSLLWNKVLWYAQQQQWHSLAVGPIAASGAGATFLTKRGAQMQQSYSLYASE